MKDTQVLAGRRLGWQNGRLDIPEVAEALRLAGGFFGEAESGLSEAEFKQVLVAKMETISASLRDVDLSCESVLRAFELAAHAGWVATRKRRDESRRPNDPF